jgi:transketolase
MRNAACQALVELHRSRPYVFLTGDLGFMALEPLQQEMGSRFINAGVAEQNMVSVAAGIASLGEQCWVYSIAPFLYARPFEQIRNDVCLHDFDVKLVGNGGGYGYGSMGSTHHALEDYGVLLTLPNMHAFVPAFADDVPYIVERMSRLPHPAYLRLGRCEKPKGFQLTAYSPWRRVLAGQAGVALVIGPLAGPLLAAAQNRGESERPDVWLLSELPLSSSSVAQEFLDTLRRDPRLVVVEEHVAQGSVGQALASDLLSRGIALEKFVHLHAGGYPSGLYGSQTFHRKENGLHPESILDAFDADVRMQ